MRNSLTNDYILLSRFNRRVSIDRAKSVFLSLPILSKFSFLQTSESKFLLA